MRTAMVRHRSATKALCPTIAAALCLSLCAVLARAVSTSGEEQYTAYCSGCHGPDGKGQGRSSRYCTVPPANLAQLAQKNKGVYPEERVCQVLRNGTGRAPQGRGYMPVWKPLLKSMNSDPPEVTELRIKNLAAYVKTLQEKPINRPAGTR